MPDPALTENMPDPALTENMPNLALNETNDAQKPDFDNPWDLDNIFPDGCFDSDHEFFNSDGDLDNSRSGPTFNFEFF